MLLCFLAPAVLEKVGQVAEKLARSLALRRGIDVENVTHIVLDIYY